MDRYWKFNRNFNGRSLWFWGSGRFFWQRCKCAFNRLDIKTHKGTRAELKDFMKNIIC